MQGPPPEKQLPSLLSIKVDPPTQVEPTGPVEVVLPQVLEDVLALKDQRAIELGAEDEGKTPQLEERGPLWEKVENVVNVSFYSLTVGFVYTFVVLRRLSLKGRKSQLRLNQVRNLKRR